MEFSLKKYLAFLLFAIICISVSIPFLGSSLNAQKPSTKPPVIVIPDEPDDVDDEVTDQIPVFKNAFDAYEYGNNLLVNGKGHDVLFYNSNEANVIGVKETQYIYYNSKRYNNIHYENVIACCDLALGENSFRFHYSDEETVYRLTTLTVDKKDAQSITDIKPIWNDTQTTVQTYEDYTTNTNKQGFNLYPFKINKTTSKQTYFKSDAKYYSFGFSINPKMLDENYVNNFRSYVDTVEFLSTTMEFVMNKKTGKFLTAVRKEYGRLTKSIATVYVTSQCNYTFRSIDTDLDIQMPQELIDRMPKPE